MGFERDVEEALGGLATEHRLRVPHAVSGPQGPELLVDGRPVVGLCSNNYLGLAGHPALAEAIRECLDEEGIGAGASRLISGTMAAHVHAEQRLARFVGAEAALLFSTGYAANVGVLAALAGPGDLVLSDQLNHASLIDGARLSRAEVVVYRHADAEHARSLLAAHRARARRALVVTESVFSMDGDKAPLVDLRAVADEHGAGLVVDEAHGLGTLGPGGRGLAADNGVRPDVLVGTLGKAFGVAGAFAAGSAALRRLLENRARSYVFSTAPLPLLAAAAATATDLVEAADGARATLAKHAERLRSALRATGADVRGDGTAIVPVVLGDERRAMAASSALLERGVFVQGIRPPTVPAGTSRLRITPMATHTDEHIARALAALGAVGLR